MTMNLSLEESRKIIGDPMVNQLATLLQSDNDPIVKARLIHNLLGKEDTKFQLAANVVWNHLVQSRLT